MTYLMIRNWAKYQHYKDRRPPWVKLYSNVLADPLFARLHDASKAHALLLMTVAAELDNRIPNDATWLAHKLFATEPVDLDALASAGWLAPYDAASAMLAEPERGASNLPPQRTENREQRTEEKQVSGASGDAPRAKRGRSGTATGMAAGMATGATTGTAARPAYPPAFDATWRVYPKRLGANPKRDAYKAWLARRRASVDAETLHAGAARYAAYARATYGGASDYVMHAARFFGPSEHFREAWTIAAGADAGPLAPPALRVWFARHNLDRPTDAATYWTRCAEAVPEGVDGEAWRALVQHLEPWKLGALPPREAETALAQRLASRPAAAATAATPAVAA